MTGSLTLRWKLGALIAGGSVLAAVIAAAGFTWFDLHRFWRQTRSEVGAIADIVADQTGPAIMLGDKKAAGQILASLRADSLISEAFLFNSGGECFAAFHRNSYAGCEERPAAVDAIMVTRPVGGPDRLGAVTLSAAVPSRFSILRQYLGGAALIILLSLMVAFIAAMVLQSAVSNPIMAMARIAQRIAQTHSFEDRVEVNSSDELGVLGGSFNAMLDEIVRRDAELAEYRSGLEQQVNAKERALAELAEAQRRLIDLSRLSGMAEVATSVLHNVGNVLNSVNVSTTVVSDKVRQLPVDNLAAVGAMLQQHNADIADFVANDPKGNRVLPYLTKLGKRFQDERKAMLTELDLLRTHVEHIKLIVSTQQSYAKVSGLVEEVSVTDLVEDACRILQTGFERHKISLERDYDKVPPLATEKHAVIQILLNLIRNAKDAIAQSEHERRTIGIRVRRQSEAFVRVEVIDSGVGIAPQDLARIFGHGFTTKPHGHGFGLHSSALDAQRMGGSLTAASEGPGCGATFTLDLPLRSGAAVSVAQNAARQVLVVGS